MNGRVLIQDRSRMIVASSIMLPFVLDKEQVLSVDGGSYLEAKSLEIGGSPNILIAGWATRVRFGSIVNTGVKVRQIEIRDSATTYIDGDLGYIAPFHIALQNGNLCLKGDRLSLVNELIGKSFFLVRGEHGYRVAKEEDLKISYSDSKAPDEKGEFYTRVTDVRK
jgi:hypothetical protein